MADDYYPIPGYVPPTFAYDRDRDCLIVTPPPPPPPPRPPTYRRYGVEICSSCNLALEYCGCAKRAADAPSADAQPTADLERRIREATAQPLPGWARFCGLCGRRVDICDGRCE